MSRSFRGLRLALTVGTILMSASGPAIAQGNTAEALSQAITLYENLEVEQALVLLRRVVSPSSPFEVSQAQRVRAYTYLGASLAILGHKDSSLVYFSAALERDPFIDLDSERFTPQERAALAQARQRTFMTAARPLVATAWDPSREQVTFTTVTTHQASLRVEIHSPGGGPPMVLHEREGDGIREVAWNGLLGGRLAPAGVYQLCVVGRSALTSRTDSTLTEFTIEHQFPELEDTIPEIPATALLPERHPPNAGRSALLKGLAVAGAAVIVPAIGGNSALREGGNGLSITAATIATGAGVAAFVLRSRSPEIPANIALNAARRAERVALNAEIAKRNQDKLALTRLVLVPGARR